MPDDSGLESFYAEVRDQAIVGDGQEALSILTRKDGDIVVWALVNWEGVPLTSGSIETSSRAGDTVSNTGTAYLNEDPLFRFQNIYQELPAGAQFQPFTLRVTCHPS